MKKKSIIVASIILCFAVLLSLSCLPKLPAEEVISTDISGTYSRETENEQATFEITLLPDGKVHVTGMAFWGTQREYGPNIGELDFTSVLVNDCIRYSEQSRQTQTYSLVLTFTKMGLKAKEEGISKNFGLNVSFAGDYLKTDP